MIKILVNSYTGCGKFRVNDPHQPWAPQTLSEEDIYYYDSSEGKTKDLIGEITLDSSFFQLQKGENIVMYEVGDASTGQLEVTLYYDNQYFNIGAM